jgi:hypothetical protein
MLSGVRLFWFAHKLAESTQPTFQSIAQPLHALTASSILRQGFSSGQAS